jgi:hypothetical protein
MFGPSRLAIPAGSTASADSARSAGALRPWPSKPHGAQSTPGRSPRVRTAAFPLRPSRLRGVPVGDVELRRNRPAGPGRHASRATPPPGRRFVFLGAGFRLRLPPHLPCGSAVAFGWESTSPALPEDSHLLATVHGGRTGRDGDCPPHRPQRALLAHWVLASNTSVEAHPGVRVFHTGRWQPPLGDSMHPLPVGPRLLASAP